MSVINFENEGEEFREYMESHPNAVVVLRLADGSCEVEEQPQTIEGESVPDMIEGVIDP